MGPADRLYVQNIQQVAPPVPGLEWFQPVYTIWAGRLPRARVGEGGGAPAVPPALPGAADGPNPAP
jgi:hypothetical protein